MAELNTMWSGASRSARGALLLGIAVIAAATMSMGYWAMSQRYEALFTGLAEQDASTMIAELDRMKVPYRLEEGGQRIMVPEDMVHRTRLQLVGKNLPLHGAVGFEIFNNTDFGMTEFAQKVNYQRALQGELTRTIMSLSEVQAARVHLALAESSLFKREQNRSKASVTLTLKPGQTLGREQVSGIQRLIAAAVPGIDLNDVTVLDQKGITLSSRREGERDSATWQLETQKQIEEHLVRKAATMLDRTFGAGQGVVSVDAVLNFDQVKVTTEEVLPAKNQVAANGAGPAGVLVRERQTYREQPGARERPESASGAVTNTDTEYVAGRRVEQIVGTPGSLRRLNVAVVVPKGVTAERLERVRQIVALAVGLNIERGDGIAVYALDQMVESSGAAAAVTAVPPAAAPLAAVAQGEAGSSAADATGVSLLASPGWRYGVLLAFAVLALAAWALSRRSPRRGDPVYAPRQLAEAERVRLLENVRLWLEQPSPSQASTVPGQRP